MRHLPKRDGHFTLAWSMYSSTITCALNKMSSSPGCVLETVPFSLRPPLQPVYRIRQARASKPSMKDHTGRRRRGRRFSHESEGDADTFYRRDRYPQNHRKWDETEKGFVSGRCDDGAPVPYSYIENVVDVPGCTAIYME